MKKIFVIVLSIMIVTVASAQKVVGHSGYYYPHTRVIVGGYYSPYYYYPLYPPPYYYDYGYRRPSRLQLKIEDIQADYRDRIYSARHDKSLSKSERKETIHQLKADREVAVRDTEKNYYKSLDNSRGPSSEP